MSGHIEYEHSSDLHAAQKALIALRKHVRRLHWMSGGKGYDNMGKRELEQLRVKIDEADFWLAASSRSLNAGGKRAVALGIAPAPPKEAEDCCGLYWCPTVGEVECPNHGGFDTCCASPELHVPVEAELLQLREAAERVVRSYPLPKEGDPSSDIDWYMRKLRDALVPRPEEAA